MERVNPETRRWMLQACPKFRSTFAQTFWTSGQIIWPRKASVCSRCYLCTIPIFFPYFIMFFFLLVFSVCCVCQLNVCMDGGATDWTLWLLLLDCLLSQRRQPPNWILIGCGNSHKQGGGLGGFRKAEGRGWNSCACDPEMPGDKFDFCAFLALVSLYISI